MTESTTRTDDLTVTTTTGTTTGGAGTTPTPRPLALVTGASSGIGLELAKQFASHGHDVVVVAEDAELDRAVADLALHGDATVHPVRADLATAEGVEQVWQAVQATGRPLSAVALNAGIGRGGAFVETPLDDELRLVDLNVRSVVHLAKLAVRDMHARGQGRVLITSSVASTMPGPFQAVYNASKSFVQSFSQALQAELTDSPVTVTALMPGPTDTEFFGRAGLRGTLIGEGPKDDPAQVAAQGYEAMMAGRTKVLGGSLLSKAQGVTSALLPDAVKAAAHRLMAKPGGAK